MSSFSSPLRAVVAAIALNLVIEHSQTSQHSSSSRFVAADDARRLNALSKTLERSNAKGVEGRNLNTISSVGRELAKKSKNNRAAANRTNTKKRGANQAKKRSNNVNNNKRNNSANNTKRKPVKKRTAVKRGRKNSTRKKVTRTNNNKKIRYTGGYGVQNKSDQAKPNKKPSGKKSNSSSKKEQKKTNVKEEKPTDIMYYPNFDMMTCVSGGMPPVYFSPMYLSTTAAECCAINFNEVVAECIVKSMGDMDTSDGGFILAINQQTTTGKSGKSGGSATWMGGAGGKSGKGAKSSQPISDQWAGSSLMDPVGMGWGGGSGKGAKSSQPISDQWAGSSLMDPVGMGWGGGMMILQTEEPTYFPSYMPTSSAQTTYAPTTYIPTYYPTSMENTETSSPTYPPTSSTYYPTTRLPTYMPTGMSDDGKDTDDNERTELSEDDKGTGETLYEGQGEATYYYDINGEFCPQDSEQYAENESYPTCSSFDKSKWMTLQDYDTNNIVAIDSKLLADEKGREKYCGKEIKVFRDGKQVKGGPYFVFDGCKACQGGKRIDFSLSALNDIDNGNACDSGIVDGISWEVLDNQIMKFVP